MVDEIKMVWDPIDRKFAPAHPWRLTDPDQGSADGDPRRARYPGRFLRGPIPWGWLARASELPGSALIVGLALWRLAGVTRVHTVTLTGKALKPLELSRQTRARALEALEAAGLVTVCREQGRAVVVTIIPGQRRAGAAARVT
jgi:hypothetical protein